MKRFLMTIALACALSSSTLAGEIPSGGFASPTPPAPNQITSAPLPGDIPSDGFAAQVSDAARSAFLTVLGLLVV